MKKRTNPHITTLSYLFLIVLVDMIGLGIVIPFIPLIFSLHNFFPTSFSQDIINITLGFLLAAYPLFQFLGSPILGSLSDKYGRKPVLTVSLLGSFIGYLLFPLGIYVSSVLLLFLSRIIDGFTGGNISVAMASIADLSKDEKSRVKNFGLIGVAFGLGFVIGPAFGGILSNTNITPLFGIHTPFIAAAFLTLFNLFLVIRFKETLKTKKKDHSLLNTFIGIKRAFYFKRLRDVFLSIFLVNLGWVFFENFFQIFLYNNFNFSPSSIALLLAYIGIWIVITQGFIVRKIAGKIKPLKVLKITLLISSFILILIVFSSKNMLYINLALLAIFVGFTQPNFSAIITSMVSKKSLGEVLGIRQSIISFSNIIPPAVGGFLLNLGVSTPLIIGSILIFLGWVLLVILTKELKKKVIRVIFFLT